MADYLESYASRFDLPVRTGVRVSRVARDGDRYVVTTGDARIEADHVIVASGAHQDPRIPAFSRELDPAIVQLHSSEYRNPSQLRDGGVLVVGAGNSGGDISFETVRTHPTWLSGPDRGHVPVDIDRWFSRYVIIRVVRFVLHHVLTLRTPIGPQGEEEVRVAGRHARAREAEVAPRRRASSACRRRSAFADGKPVLEDGRVLDVTNVIWCTGFRHDLSWIDLPIFGEDGEPMHERGVATNEPGLYFVGLPFQYAASSDVLPGVGRDARYVVKHLVARAGGRADRAEMTTAA